MPGWINAGYDDYARRMPPDMPLVLTEIKPGHRVAGEDGAKARQLEAERILAALPAGCVPVVLDERGAQLATRELAAWLQGWMAEGMSPAFVIGGADGLDDSVKARAGKLLGLSKLTLAARPGASDAGRAAVPRRVYYQGASLSSGLRESKDHAG